MKLKHVFTGLAATVALTELAVAQPQGMGPGMMGWGGGWMGSFGGTWGLIWLAVVIGVIVWAILRKRK